MYVLHRPLCVDSDKIPEGGTSFYIGIYLSVQTCTGTRTLCLRTTATGTDSPRIGTTSPRTNTEGTIHRAAGNAAFCSQRRRGESANHSATVRSTMCAGRCFGSDSLNVDPDPGILRIRIQFGYRSRPRFL